MRRLSRISLALSLPAGAVTLGGCPWDPFWSGTALDCEVAGLSSNGLGRYLAAFDQHDFPHDPERRVEE